MDDIEEVINSQGEPYQTEPHDRSWESDDDSKQDQRLHSATDVKYNGSEQEHVNRFRQLKKQQSLFKVYLFTPTTSHFG